MSNNQLHELHELVEAQSDEIERLTRALAAARAEADKKQAEFEQMASAAGEAIRSRNSALEELAAARAGCHPECPGCGLRPDNTQGQATLWCDECVSTLRRELSEARESVRTLLRDARRWSDSEWYLIVGAEAYGAARAAGGGRA